MPWVKKSDEEIQGEKRGATWLGISVTFFLTLAFLSVSTKLGIRKYSAPDNPLSWDEFLQVFPILLFVSIPFSLFLYWWWNFSGIGKSSWMCDTCDETKKADDIIKCSCGGNFVPISQYKWIDQKIEGKDPIGEK